MATKISGIYQIKNTVNGKVYVGSSVNIYERWKCHKKMLRHNYHSNEYLQNAWDKYGEKTFEFSMLEECDKDILIEREQFWIDTCNSSERKFGYNLCPKADMSLHSEETKQKISKTKTGAKLSQEHIEASRRGLFKYFKDENNRIKNSAAIKKMYRDDPEEKTRTSLTTKEGMKKARNGK